MGEVIKGPWDRMSVGAYPGTIVNWFYQLQDIDPELVGKINASIKVVDSCVDGVMPFQSKYVAAMRGHPSTILLSYLSIGEAENYRAYWAHEWAKEMPLFIDEENPEWKGNFKVRFWHHEWQAIVKQEIDIIIAQGFDGVYLDIIDAYEYWEQRGVPTARQQMARFVWDLAVYARKKKPGFWIVPQNGEGLLSNETYRDVINAIAIEDLIYGENQDEVRTPAASTSRRLDDIKLFLPTGKPMLAVEYVTTPTVVQAAKRFYNDTPFHLFVTSRDLDQPTLPPVLR